MSEGWHKDTLANQLRHLSNHLDPSRNIMGRLEPSNPLAPQAFRKDQRAKQARATINKTIPAILASDARARNGVEAAELISDPPPVEKGTSRRRSVPDDEGRVSSKPEVRLEVADTLSAAHRLSRKKGSVAILNMASPLRPGGGVLNGATSQEESLCVRTTLLPTLKEEWYRLPDVGGIFSPGVCVFRLPDNDGETERELAKMERFHVGVVSAAMLRFPDVVEGDEGLRYASEQDREMVSRKMRAVLRILKSKGVERVVLGAWGCGAYGNPVGEIARAWKRVILGSQKKARVRDAGEIWYGLEEIVFAIKDRKIAEQFAVHWGPELEVENGRLPGSDVDDGDTDAQNELVSKIQELEIQVSQTQIPIVKERLENILSGLRAQLAETQPYKSVETQSPK